MSCAFHSFGNSQTNPREFSDNSDLLLIFADSRSISKFFTLLARVKSRDDDSDFEIESIFEIES